MSTKQPTASDVIFTVGVEALGVGLLAVLAGSNDDVGSLIVLFMAGLWLLFFVTDSKAVSSLLGAFSNLDKNGAT
jgi:hypothetical protein